MLLLLVLIGVLTGLTTVLFGFGGGFVTVPVIMWVEIAAADDAGRMAVATSAVVMVANAAIATLATRRDVLGRLRGRRLLLLLLGTGGAVGAAAALQVPAWIASVGFVAYLAVTIVDVLVRPGFLRPAAPARERSRAIPDVLGAPIGAVAAGLLPTTDALHVADRVWPILLFVVAITVVAELASFAGVFDALASRLARWARGRVLLLWLLVAALAVVVTTFLSLDTTAVLLTPVVITVARVNGLRPLPFAFITVWLANTASLFLPVSNLTNLLAAHTLDGGNALSFVALMIRSAAVAVIVTVGVLWFISRRSLRGRFEPTPPKSSDDRALLRFCGIVLAVMMPLLVVLPPWIPALAAAVVLIVAFVRRAPDMLRWRIIPWQLVVFASGLFLAVAVLERLGSATLLASVVGSGDDLLSLWQLAGVGMLGANIVNNLPAYLALEATAGSPVRLAALLIGVGAGPLITPWASLATLLWHSRLSSLGVAVPWRRYVLLGCVAGPVVVACSVIPLALH